MRTFGEFDAHFNLRPHNFSTTFACPSQPLFKIAERLGLLAVWRGVLCVWRSKMVGRLVGGWCSRWRRPGAVGSVRLPGALVASWCRSGSMWRKGTFRRVPCRLAWRIRATVAQDLGGRGVWWRLMLSMILPYASALLVSLRLKTSVNHTWNMVVGMAPRSPPPKNGPCPGCACQAGVGEFVC